jgi:hypothetical protein
VQQIVQAYRDWAGVAQRVHPHVFRHQMLTFLTSRGMSDTQIQLISGHESKQSVEGYQASLVEYRRRGLPGSGPGPGTLTCDGLRATTNRFLSIIMCYYNYSEVSSN